MLNDAYFSRMMSCRSLEKVRLGNPAVYFSIHDALLQMCDECGLKNTTKYIIKKSIDTYILNYPTVQPLEISFAAMNFYCMAIKMNESLSHYDGKLLEKSRENVYGNFTQEDYIKFEKEFYNKKGFEMNFPTPYDYLGLYESVFPMKEEMKKRVNFLLDFSFFVPELMFNTAEEIFFGCMIAGCRDNILQMSWILSQTHSEERSKQVAAIVLQMYEEDLKSPQNPQFQ